MIESKEFCMSDDNLYTVPEVSKKLRISVRVCRELIRVGALPTIRVGRSYRISGRALSDWLAAGGKRVTAAEYRAGRLAPASGSINHES